LIFAWIRFGARYGLAEASLAPSVENPGRSASPAKKAARKTGIRGETYAYWYLRRKGYMLVAKNYTVAGIKGEIDMVGYDGATLAFIEVKTRIQQESDTNAAQQPPELAVNREKRRNLSRMARHFLRIQHINTISHRFDVLAIESRPGHEPQVRLHKGAFHGET
jgi:putative endonuclease